MNNEWILRKPKTVQDRVTPSLQHASSISSQGSNKMLKIFSNSVNYCGKINSSQWEGIRWLMSFSVNCLPTEILSWTV